MLVLWCFPRFFNGFPCFSCSFGVLLDSGTFLFLCFFLGENHVISRKDTKRSLGVQNKKSCLRGIVRIVYCFSCVLDVFCWIKRKTRRSRVFRTHGVALKRFGVGGFLFDFPLRPGDFVQKYPKT